MLKKMIRITLMSDICLASGYSFAGIIDTDVCYDDYGLPYIPARRLKGCLREAAELIGVDTLLFGKGGQGFEERTSLEIEDGHVENYALLKDYLEKHREEILPDTVLELYTFIKGQTRIGEKGVAEENTLRYTRIVRCRNPLGDGKLAFEAEVVISAQNAEQEQRLCKELEKCVKALRHMGYNRNRGLGNVKCELKGSDMTIKAHVSSETALGNSEKKILRYVIKTSTPLIISQGSNLDTETYISGKMVHGFFASRYLRAKGGADEKFNEIFLRKNVCFSPLYPSDRWGNIYVPAPNYIGQLKKSRHLVNLTTTYKHGTDDTENNIEPENPGYGNQAKKLKNKYIRRIGNTYDIKEVETDIFYHNRHEKDEVEALLFGFEAIAPEQYFAGSIEGAEENLDILQKLLQESSVTFGKSVSAQYGRCDLIKLKYENCSRIPETIDVEEGEEILVVLESDGIFIRNNVYTNRADDVRECIRESIIKNENSENSVNYGSVNILDGEYTEISAKKITGYYSVWNMKRQALPGIAAGSGFSYKVTKEAMLPTILHVGENTGEGFGIARVLKRPTEWVLQKPEKQSDKAENKKKERRLAENLDSIFSLYCEENKDSVVGSLLYGIAYKMAERLALEWASEVNDVAFNAASVGRLALMLDESEAEAAEKGVAVIELFGNRVKSIKDKEKKNNAQNLLDNLKKWKIPEKFEALEKDRLQAACLRQTLIWMKYRIKEEQ